MPKNDSLEYEMNSGSNLNSLEDKINLSCMVAIIRILTSAASFAVKYIDTNCFQYTGLVLVPLLPTRFRLLWEYLVKGKVCMRLL